MVDTSNRGQGDISGVRADGILKEELPPGLPGARSRSQAVPELPSWARTPRTKPGPLSYANGLVFIFA